MASARARMKTIIWAAVRMPATRQTAPNSSMVATSNPNCCNAGLRAPACWSSASRTSGTMTSLQ
eukprot:5612715-Lingulodinium_polyedra.AAC.1